MFPSYSLVGSMASLLVLASGCMTRRSQSTPNVVGGKDAKIGEFPSTVYFPQTVCSGVMVSKTQVLTAGHCIQQSLGNFIIGPGSQLVLNTYVAANEINPYVSYESKVKEVSIHPSWILGLVQNPNVDAVADAARTSDVALITLENSIPIPVAEISRKALKKTVDKVVIVGGGCDKQTFRPTIVLKSALFPILAVEENKYILNPKSSPSSNPASGCQGDSGGAGYLAQASGQPAKGQSGQFIVAGVLSTTLPQAGTQQLAPTVVARTDSINFTDWFDLKLKNENSPVAKLFGPQTLLEALEEERKSNAPNAEKLDLYLRKINGLSDLADSKIYDLVGLILNNTNKRKSVKEIIDEFKSGNGIP